MQDLAAFHGGARSAKDLDPLRARPADVPSRSLCFLLADDHPMFRRRAAVILREFGCELVSVADGSAAVAAFATGRFDAVLMDMQMPVMDGLAAVRRIRAIEVERKAPRTPIVMVTANVQSHHVRASRSAGADGHIGKPYTAEQLIGSLVDLLEAR